MGELDFSSTSFLTVSIFSSIILVGEDLEDVTGGHKSVDNSGEGVTACEEADVVRIWTARGIPFLKQLDFWIFHSWLQSKCFGGVEMSDFF